MEFNQYRPKGTRSDSGSAVALLTDVGDVGQTGRLLRSDNVVPPSLAHHLADRREPDVYSRGGESFHARPPLH